MITSPRPRPFKPEARVRFKPGYRPTACTLPEVMTVFLSKGRETVVLVDGKPIWLATQALEKA